MQTDIATDQKLIDRLTVAAGQPMTREEVRRQRLSFVFGNLPNDSDMTRPQVEEALDRLEGEAA